MGVRRPGLAVMHALLTPLSAAWAGLFSAAVLSVPARLGLLPMLPLAALVGFVTFLTSFGFNGAASYGLWTGKAWARRVTLLLGAASAAALACLGLLIVIGLVKAKGSDVFYLAIGGTLSLIWNGLEAWWLLRPGRASMLAMAGGTLSAVIFFLAMVFAGSPGHHR